MKKKKEDQFVGSDYNGEDWFYNEVTKKVYIPLDPKYYTAAERRENGYFAATFDEAINMLREGIIP